MNFLETIFDRLEKSPGHPILQETREGQIEAATTTDLARVMGVARHFLRQHGFQKGARCALLAPNSIRWTATDLAIIAEGGIAVPLYARQAVHELVGMMKDCAPALILCGDEALRASVRAHWPDAPPTFLLDEVFSQDTIVEEQPAELGDPDPVTILYTSGTSGEPKGVVLTAGNVTFMLGATSARLDQLMGPRNVPDQVFHYLPTCFAGSWILLLTCLRRGSVLTLSTDLTKLADELKLASPNYMLNVPVLLDRMRAGIEDQITKKGGIPQTIVEKGRAAWLRRESGHTIGLMDSFWLALGERLVFRVIRTKIGPNLRALICGSAPLSKETQLFFMMLGLPVLQVYGLTETTAICTMDNPHHVTPGRVGPAHPRYRDATWARMTRSWCAGRTYFPDTGTRPAETQAVFADGWFRTGDQGEVDAAGNWAVIGRLKNLIIPPSGHNVAPEPIEGAIQKALPAAKQVMLVGNDRSHLAAILTGDLRREEVQAALDQVNPALPHYKRVRGFHISAEPFTIENGLLTANGKFQACRDRGSVWRGD